MLCGRAEVVKFEVRERVRVYEKFQLRSINEIQVNGWKAENYLDPKAYDLLLTMAKMNAERARLETLRNQASSHNSQVTVH